MDKFSCTGVKMEIKVALRVLYVGYKFHGFEMQSGFETIEGVLERVLLKIRVIEDLKSSGWSKCGRTDVGVSSYGQIVSFRMQEKRLKGLCNTLNSVLPREIRVLGVSRVDQTFDARFSCLERKYKYFFPAQGLNLLKMQEAASLFIGTNNCKNFCKVNPQKETRYCRSISKSFIQELGKEDLEEQVHSKLPERELDPNKFYVYVIQGRAFLWHQVRCIVSALYTVGLGLEEPESIKDLLKEENILENKGRPNYDMAPEGPLVLVDCIYPEGTFNWDEGSQELDVRKTVLMPLYLQWKDYATKARQMESVLESLILKDSDKRDSKDYLRNMLEGLDPMESVDGKARIRQSRTNYVKILDRPRMQGEKFTRITPDQSPKDHVMEQREIEGKRKRMDST
jgi:tRNA pseudouridine38/39 synthase